MGALFWLFLVGKNNPAAISFCQCVIIQGFAKASTWDEVVSGRRARRKKKEKEEKEERKKKKKKKHNFSFDLK